MPTSMNKPKPQTEENPPVGEALCLSPNTPINAVFRFHNNFYTGTIATNGHGECPSGWWFTLPVGKLALTKFQKVVWDYETKTPTAIYTSDKLISDNGIVPSGKPPIFGGPLLIETADITPPTDNIPLETFFVDWGEEGEEINGPPEDEFDDGLEEERAMHEHATEQSTEISEEEFEISWRINVRAKQPMTAAQLAFKLLRDRKAFVHMFEVQNLRTKEVITVDLDAPLVAKAS